jgi:hypothetical protein
MTIHAINEKIKENSHPQHGFHPWLIFGLTLSAS